MRGIKSSEYLGEMWYLGVSEKTVPYHWCYIFKINEGLLKFENKKIPPPPKLSF